MNVKSIMFGFLLGAVAAVVVPAIAVSTVSSYTPPALVSEINTALANPVHTTLQVTGAVKFTGLQDGSTNGLVTGSLYVTNGIVHVYPN